MVTSLIIKKIYLLRYFRIIFLIIPVLYLSPCQKLDNNKTIKLYDGRWESLYINNAIVKYILENGYGYKVETVELTSDVLQDAFNEGKIDVVLEFWEQNPSLKKFFNRNTNAVNLGPIFGDGPQFWIIPKWVSDKYSIITVYDMKKHWHLFANPTNKSKGIFYCGVSGWSCVDINKLKMSAYGLDKYYDMVEHGSNIALDATYERSQEKHEPVFGYYWEPASLMGEYEWHKLEEPPYTDECWNSISKAISEKQKKISGACSYQDIPVYKIVHKKLIKSAPDAALFISSFSIGIEPLNKTCAWTKKTSRENWDAGAKFYLKNNESSWKNWVSDKAYSKITMALNKEK